MIKKVRGDIQKAEEILFIQELQLSSEMPSSGVKISL